MLFYKIPRVVLAPNREVAELLESGTGKPTFLMSREVNTDRALAVDLLSWDRIFIDICSAYEAAMTAAEKRSRINESAGPPAAASDSNRRLPSSRASMRSGLSRAG
jgi:anti-sigma-K factor RskA